MVASCLACNFSYLACKSLRNCCKTQKGQQGGVELYRKLHAKLLPTQTSRGRCRQSTCEPSGERPLRRTTFPCKGRQWSNFLSSFQESMWTSASPRKVFLPKRPWCQTENCKVLWARRDSEISYCEGKEAGHSGQLGVAPHKRILPNPKQPVSIVCQTVLVP